MENASKALLIAAAVLIAILLLTLFSYLMTRMSENTARIHAIMEESEIAEFNQQFLNYEGIGTPLTAQDVVTIINLANNANQMQKWPVTINVLVDGTNISNIEEFLIQNIESKYKCNSIEIDSSTKIVKKVTIVKI